MKKLLSSLVAVSITTSAFALDVKLSNKITNKEKEVLKRDFKNLSNTNLGKAQSKAYKKFFGSDEIEGKSLTSWLEDRVQFVVEKNYLDRILETRDVEIMGFFNEQSKLDQKEEPSGIEKSIARGHILDDIEQMKGSLYSSPDNFINRFRADEQSGVVMQNTGTALYSIGKQNGFIIGVKIESGEDKFTVPVSSPRTGIIEIGPVLISKRNQANIINDNAKANSYMRIGTYLHEARHSDGNEKSDSLGFMHAYCPKGHALAEKPACDTNINGPYAIGGVYYYETASSCKKSKDCSKSEEASLMARAFDSFSRIHKIGGQIKIHDETPEGERLENR